MSPAEDNAKPTYSFWENQYYSELIQTWYDGRAPAGVTLHEYLGMTLEQYEAWMESRRA